MATILYLRKSDAEVLDDDLFAKIKKIKPYLSDRLLIIALNKVKELLFKPEYLTDDIKNELELWESAKD